MNTCINIKIKTKAIILDHLQAALSLPSRYHYKAPQSGSDKLLWGNIRSILSLWKNQSNKLVLFSFLLQNYCSAGSVSSSDSSCNPVTFGHNTRKTVPVWERMEENRMLVYTFVWILGVWFKVTSQQVSAGMEQSIQTETRVPAHLSFTLLKHHQKLKTFLHTCPMDM